MTNPSEAGVLAVLDEFVGIVGDEFGNDPALRLRKARATIAEYMDAIEDVYGEPPTIDVNAGDDPCPPSCMTCRIRKAHAAMKGVVS